jgi:hypothetical protein
MGAMVRIICDAEVVAAQEAKDLAEGLQKLIVQVIQEDDVFVYVEQPALIVAADPIEIFVQVNQQDVADPAELTERIASELAAWSEQTNFPHKVNLNVVPVNWHFKVGIKPS